GTRTIIFHWCKPCHMQMMLFICLLHGARMAANLQVKAILIWKIRPAANYRSMYGIQVTGRWFKPLTWNSIWALIPYLRSTGLITAQQLRMSVRMLFVTRWGYSFLTRQPAVL